jgi:hypothetical protein
LSAHIWKIKDRNEDYIIKWAILDRGKKFNPTTGKCLLCLKEKFHRIEGEVRVVVVGMGGVCGLVGWLLEIK